MFGSNRSFMLFHFIAESNSQPVAPTYVDGNFKGCRTLLRAVSYCKCPGEIYYPRSQNLVQPAVLDEVFGSETDDGLLAPLHRFVELFA